MDKKIKDQILSIRNMGVTNMFDISFVQRIAFKNHYYELVYFLEEHRKEYVHFILTGDEK